MPAEPRRRMSRHISLVLMGSLPGLAGCGGCGDSTSTAPATQPAPEMEEVEEVTEDPPPEGSDHLIGAPFVAWWALTHPPIVTHRLVPRAQVIAGNSGYTRSSSGIYRRTYYGGRSTYIFGGGFYGGGGSYSRPAPGHSSSGVVRGGFGGSGHAASGGGS